MCATISEVPHGGLKHIIVTAVVILAAAGLASSTQAHRGKATWSPAYTESRVFAKGRFRDNSEVEDRLPNLREAKERLAAAIAEGYNDEILRARVAVAEIEGYIADAKKGWRIKDVRCIGVGRPNRHYRFAHVKCAALLDVAWWPDSEWMQPSNVLFFTAHPIDRLRFVITNKRWTSY